MSKKPWPTKAVMQQIYEQHLWGGKEFDFYSGYGSHRREIVQPYLDAVIEFFKSQNNSLTVCDLGCGDFNIAKHFAKFVNKYIAIDIVKDLIERNTSKFREDNLEFLCLDIAKDKLPPGDCIILRQVLQHLSNKEIQQIIPKLDSYKYIILTEHLPKGNFIPNKTIISGQGIRLKQNSGVKLLDPPFNFKVIEEKILNETILGNDKGCITTTLYTCF